VHLAPRAIPRQRLETLLAQPVSRTGWLAGRLLLAACAATTISLVTVAFLWQLAGSLLGAPTRLVDVTPFEHVGLVPSQPFRAGPALVMLAIGALSALAAIGLFRRRDVVGA
jgi:ABC-2 type transport system permease protein